jgi:PAS domain S-box-containing protein
MPGALALPVAAFGGASAVGAPMATAAGAGAILLAMIVGGRGTRPTAFGGLVAVAAGTWCALDGSAVGEAAAELQRLLAALCVLAGVGRLVDAGTLRLERTGFWGCAIGVALACGMVSILLAGATARGFDGAGLVVAASLGLAASGTIREFFGAETRRGVGAWVGAGLLLAGLLGLAFGSVDLPRLGSDSAATPLASLLMGLLGARAAHDFAMGRRTTGIVGGALAAAIGLASLLLASLRPELLGGDPQPMLQAGRVVSVAPAWLMPPTVAAILVAMTAVLLTTLIVDRNRIGWALGWLCGLALMLLGVLGLVGWLGGYGTRFVAGAPPLTVLGSLAIAAIAVGIMQTGASAGNLVRGRTLWLPMFAAALVLAATAVAWRETARQEEALQRESGQLAVERATKAVRDGLVERVESLSRMAVLLAETTPEARATRLALDGHAQLRDLPGSIAVILVGPELRALDNVVLERVEWVEPGTLVGFEPRRIEAYRRAAETRRAVLLGPLDLSYDRGTGFLVIVPIELDGRQHYLVASHRYGQFLQDALRDVAPEYEFAVAAGGTTVFRRRFAPAAAAQELAFSGRAEILRTQWTVEARPSLAARRPTGSLPSIILFAGLALAALVSVALRLAAVARQRADDAELSRVDAQAAAAAQVAAQRQLAESRAEAARVLDSMSDAVFSLDRERRLTFVNALARELFERDGTPAPGRRLDEFLPAGPGSALDRACASAADSTDAVEFSLYAPEVGRWFAGRVRSTSDGLVLLLHDVTEARRAELFDREQRELLRGIALGTPLDAMLLRVANLYDDMHPGAMCSIVLLDAEHHCLRASVAPRLPAEYAQAIDGVPIGPASGSCGTAMYRGERVVVTDIASDPLWADFRDVARRFQLGACWSHPFRARDGQSLGSLAVYHPRPRHPTARELDEMETLAALCAIAVERAQVQRRIEESQQRLRSLFSHQPDAVFALDTEGVVTDVNEASVAISGYPREQLLGRSYSGLIAPAERARVHAHFGGALAGELQQYETNGLRSDGAIRRVAVTNLPIFVDGRIVGVYGVARDVTEQRAIEARLLERDRFFSLSPLVFAISDAEGRLTHVNDALARLMCVEREAMLGGRIADFAADALARDREAAWGIPPGGTLSGFVNRYRCGDGAVHWLDWNALRADDGTLFATARDVSEEIRLQRSEALMRRTIEASPAVLWRWTAGRGWPVAFVTENVSQWGYAPGDFVAGARTFIDIVHPEDREEYQRLAEECIRRGQPTFDHVYRIRKKDGGIAWVDERTTVESDEAGGVLHWQGITLDVTEHESARLALLERDRFFELSPDLFAILASDGYLMQVNRSFTGVFGWDAEELYARPVGAFLHPDDMASAEAARRALDGGAAAIEALALRFLCRDGSIKLIEWNARRVEDGRILVSGRDVTEERRAQEQERVLNRIIEDSPAVMWRWRVLPEHKVEVVSENVRRWGYEPEDFTSGRLRFDTLIHPEDYEHARYWVTLAHDPSVSQFHDTYRIRTASGQWIWLDERTTIVRDPDGSPAYLQGITFDVTEAQRAREEERKLYRAIDTGPAVFSRFNPYRDPTTEQISANVRRWGYAPEDFIRGVVRFTDLIHPDDYEMVVTDGMRRMEAGEDRLAREWRLRRADGTWVWISEYLQVVRDADGRVDHCFALTIDVDEQHQARETERQLHRVIELSPAVLWRFDLSLPVPTQVVSANVAQWGYSPEDFTSGRVLFDDLIHPDDLPRVVQMTRPAIASGAREIQLEFRFRTADGRWVWLDERVTVIRDSGGRLVDCVSLTLDITPQRQAMQAVHERDQFYALSLEVFAVADAEARFRQVNEALTRVLGFPSSRFTGHYLVDYIHPEDRPRAYEAMRALARGERVDMVELRCQHADGGWRWLEWNAAAGAGGLYYCAARDVTEHRRVSGELRRALRDLEVRNAELQDFAFVASHDLQEPLRKVQAFSDRVLVRYGERLDDTGRDYLRRMDAAAARMQTLIDDLLAYSRVSTRGESFRPVELDRVLREVVSDLDARLESSGGEIDAGALPTVDADPTQMRQLLQNLLGNALKFSLPGRRPKVVVRAEPAEVGRPGERRPGWRIAVSDNGVGFEPAHAERIFAPFQRLHGRSEYEGTGMGLAIVRKIVERHGGSVTATGVPGEGAVFAVELPSSQARALRGPVREAIDVEGES